ncbi:MAG: hypothetical protein ACRDTN_12640 [Mycobacterium sp.]
MRLRNFIAFIGVAAGAGLGAALAASPSAVAAPDPIDEAWPYGVPDVGPTLPSFGTTLPGFPDTASITNQETQNFGPIALSQADFNYLHSVGGSDWYSVHDSTFVIPDLFTDDQQKVTDLLDTTATYPTVGTVATQFELFPINTPAVGGVSLIQGYSLDDPQLGSASAFALPGIANTFISDTAGMKDVINFFGQPFTVLDIPLSTSGSAAASDLGDGAQQLLTELASLFPGADTLF